MQTKNDLLIGNIDKIICKNHHYLCLDKDQKSVLLFTEQGTQVVCIHKVGNGPQEYIDATDCDMDTNNNIYIYSASNRKIIKYISPNYNTSELININQLFTEFSIDYQSNIWIANLFTKDGCVGLSLYRNGEITTMIPPRSEIDNLREPLPFKPQSFFHSEQTLLFNQRYSPDVYKIENGELLLFTSVAPESFASEQEILANFKNQKKPNSTGSNKAYGFYSLYLIGRNLTGQVALSNGILFLSHDLKKKQSQVFRFLSKEFPQFHGIAAATEDAIITYIYPDQISSATQDSALSQHKVNVNPIIVKSKI